MRVKLFVRAADVPIESLETEINAFLEDIEGRDVRHVSVSVSDIERVASVWYDQEATVGISETVTAELEKIMGHDATIEKSPENEI